MILTIANVTAAQCQVTHLTHSSSALLKEREGEPFTSRSVDAPDHPQESAENFQCFLNPAGLEGVDSNKACQIQRSQSE